LSRRYVEHVEAERLSQSRIAEQSSDAGLIGAQLRPQRGAMIQATYRRRAWRVAVRTLLARHAASSKKSYASFAPLTR
jgi:hypothetical protein